MKKNFFKKAAASVSALSLLIAPFATNFSNVYAASLTDVEVTLTNETTSATDNAVITFTPNTAISNGSVIEIAYDQASAGPNGFDGGAELTNADITVSGTNITSSAESDFADGYFKSTLTTSADVTTVVTITIDGTNELTNPTAAGNFNFSVVVDIGGAGTTYDYGAGLAYVANDNDVTVTAVVPPILDMELYQTGSDSELVDPNSCDLGVLSLNTVKSCNYDIGFATNNTAGLTINVVRDALLNSGTNDIDDVSDGAVSAGNEEYGFQITDIGAGCSAIAQGNYGSQDEPVPGSTANFIVSSAVCNGTTAGQSAKRAEVTHSASMDTDTIVGAYDQIVTYTAFTN